MIWNLIQKLNPKQKTLPLFDTEKILSIGDRVKTKFILELDDIRTEFDYIGIIIDTNERYITPSIKSSYKLQYKVRRIDKNCSSDWYNIITSWVDSKDVILYSLEEEREDKLNQILDY